MKRRLRFTAIAVCVAAGLGMAAYGGSTLASALGLTGNGHSAQSSSLALASAKSALPVVKGVSPASGATVGGSTVTITGTGFTKVSKVLFGSVAGANLHVLGSTMLTVAAPKHAVGTVDVRVVAMAGTSAVKTADRYVYQALPVVAKVSPASGANLGGTAVTITGTGFTKTSEVRFGIAPALKVKVVSPTKIIATAPAWTPATVDVRVTGAHGLSPAGTADRYVYHAPASNADQVPAAAMTPAPGMNVPGSAAQITVPHTVPNICVPSIQQVSGTLAADTTWAPKCVTAYVINGTLDVPEGVTLTIAPGTVVKGSASASLQVDGSLVVAGSADAPAVFTSMNDNSVGGATGNGSPKAGSWGGISVTWGGSADVEHARVSYAKTGVAASTPEQVQVLDSVFSSLSSGGVQLSQQGAAGTAVEGNSVAGSGSAPAYSVQSGSLDLGLLWGNSATGGIPGFFLTGTVTASSTLQTQAAPWLVSGGCGLTVDDGVTVTMAAGTVVKGADGQPYLGDDCSGTGTALYVFGSLTVAGTAADPVTFTSVNDNSVGGATGNGSPAAGDWGGIYVVGSGSVDMEHAQVSYAKTGVAASTSGPVQVLDSVFSSLSSGGVQVGNQGVPEQVAVEGNSVTGSGSEPAYWVDGNSLDLGLLGGNSATGGIPGFFLTGTVASSTLQAQAAPWLVSGGCALTVPEGVTMTVAAGAVVKGGDGQSYLDGGCSGTLPALQVTGSLTVAGTAADPVVFTSVNDNSVGGATGTGSPAAGDWGGIMMSSSSGAADVQNARVSYATTGLQVSTPEQVQVLDSVFSSLSSGGVLVIQEGQGQTAGSLEVEGNSVTDSGSQPAYVVESESLDLGLLSGNSATGGIPGFFLTGAVAVSSTLQAQQIPWLVSGACEIYVPEGVTMTVAAGAVVKGSNGPSSILGGSCVYSASGHGTPTLLEVQGSLTVAGTAADPVVFTSVNDNSVGGTTGSRPPAAGDWPGIDVSIQGSADIEHAQVSYATTGLYAETWGPSVKVTDSAFSSLSSGAVRVNTAGSAGSTVDIEGNSVTGSGSMPAYWVDSSSLDLGLLGGNSATGGIPGFFLDGTVTASSTLQAQAAPWLIGGGSGCDVSVPQGVSLTVAAGTVVKGTGADYLGDSCAADAVALDVDGSLTVAGTAADPVVFTSVNDNSVGGATGNGSPAAGDWDGIYVDSPSGESVDVEHARVSYARTGLFADTSGSLQVLDSVFSSLSFGGVQVQVTSGGQAEVEGNSVTDSGSAPAYSVWEDSLDLGPLEGNSATGGIPGLALGGTLAASATLSPQTLPWMLQQVTVPQGMALTIAPGTVVKGEAYVQVDGSLTAAGTAADPVTFTSMNDNSVGGVTGTGSPAAGDWGGIGLVGVGTFDLENTNIKYAATALDATGSAGGVFHGSVVTSAFGVAGGDDYLDATGVDWGDPSGPAPIGTGVGYSGSGVNVIDWVGETPPTAPTSTPPYTPPTTYDCKPVAFIGARGSGEDPQGDPEPEFGDDPSDVDSFGLGTRVNGMLKGFEDEYGQYGGYGADSNVKVLAVQYRALGVLSDPMRMVYDQDYIDSIYDGVGQTVEMVSDEADNCPSEKIVLGGYSQGSLAIHIALRWLESDDPSALTHVAAVLLLADPAKVANDGGEIWENDPNLYANYEAGSGVRNADGIWTTYSLFDLGPVPGAVEGQTLEYCHNHDFVCSIGLGASFSNHTSYTSSETGAIGTWAADQVLGRTYAP